jgi:predicted nuclease of predicted toxin-antitoxin system
VSGLRFQLDEDCQAVALAQALWQHGIEATTTNAALLRGADDETQLRAATAAGRVIVTNNIRDFAPLHIRWLSEARPPHADIVLFPQQDFSIGEVVRRLAHLSHTLSSDQMKNRLEWLNAWGPAR